MKNRILFSIVLCVLFSCKKEKNTPVVNPVTTSPGKYLLFDSDQDYNTGKTKQPSLFTSIYYTNLDGTNIQRVTTPPANYFDYRAAVSADGTKIAFTRDNEDGTDRGIWTVNVDGTNLLQVKKGLNIDYVQFSPDGKYLAYSKEISNGSGYDIFVANVDGTSEKRITTFASGNGDTGIPYWSGDGNIYFNGTPDNKVVNFYSISPDGTNQKIISTSLAGVLCLSPDGKLTIYTNGVDLFISNIDGTNTKNITNSTVQLSFIGAKFSKDQKQVYFFAYNQTSNIQGIFKVNVDGTGMTKVLPGEYEYPSVF